MQAHFKSCCQNKKCPDYGKRGAKNSPVFDWFGKKGNLCSLIEWLIFPAIQS